MLLLSSYYSSLYSVPSSIRTGPICADPFRGDSPTPSPQGYEMRAIFSARFLPFFFVHTRRCPWEPSLRHCAVRAPAAAQLTVIPSFFPCLVSLVFDFRYLLCYFLLFPPFAVHPCLRCAGKPHYDMAPDGPLLLHGCRFRSLNFQYTPEVMVTLPSRCCFKIIITD